MQRLRDNVSGKWQKFTTMVNQGISKESRKPFLKKSILIYDNDRKENTLIHAHHSSYIKIRQFSPLSEPDNDTNVIKRIKCQAIC